MGGLVSRPIMGGLCGLVHGLQGDTKRTSESTEHPSRWSNL